IILRNTVNDWRAGRIKQIDRKIENRRAKRAYKQEKTTANKKALHDARVNRFVKNGLASMTGVDVTSIEGKYTRYRSNGKAAVDAGLMAAGAVFVTAIATNTATRYGMDLMRDVIHARLGKIVHLRKMSLIDLLR
ncbi:MAG: hypothetical protein IJ241_08430, partial [Clostridia bacterium]|nr:hypothetical protein [Clostridia bacterium]